MLNELSSSSYTKRMLDEDEESPSSSLRARGGRGGEEEHVNLYQAEEDEESDHDDDVDDDVMQQQQQQQVESNTALTTTTTTTTVVTAIASTAAASLMEDHQSQQSQQPSTSSLIRCMPEPTIRRIVAGQAILDLASAVKELLDNALDAHSTCINIRLFNQGIDLLEVSDDGVGVPLHSRPYLCTPHATSKLNHDDNLQHGIQTLGFRGEALYSLAHLSGNVVIATRTNDDNMAQKMSFTPTGQLVEESVVEMPRKVGTTVCIQDFLAAVPVRRADFLRRLPTQRSKLIHLCQGYALFCAAGSGSSSSASSKTRQQYYRPPCQLRLMDMISRNDGSAEERIILQTPNQSSTTNNTSRCTILLGRAISAILGTVVLQQLCEVSINVTDVVMAAAALKKETTTATGNAAAMDSSDDDDDDLINPDGTPRWTVAGFISKAQPPAATASLDNQDSSMRTRPHVKASRRVGHIPTTNTGNPNQQQGNNNATATSATTGHQFFCINGRPVEMPKLTRLLNEQWRNCHNSNNNNNNKDDATAQATKKNKKRGGGSSSSGRVGRPCIILQFTIPFQAYDINLSPDKRQAVLLGEDDILQRIIQVVASLWQSQTNADHVQFQSFEESEAAVAAMNKAAAARNNNSRNNSRRSSCCSSPDNLSSPIATTSFTAEQLEGSGRFNRRYAFSHDVRKARLQHEFDDGRKRQHFSNDDNDDDDDDYDNDGDDNDDDGEQEERRRRPDYDNYQPGYGPDENDVQLDAMLWQQEQIKRQLEAQEKEIQRQQQQAAAAALFAAARQKELASSVRKNSANNDDTNNSPDEKKHDAGTTATDECTTTTTTATKLTESSRLSIENAKTAQRIGAAAAAAAVSTMTNSSSSHNNNVSITPSPPMGPRQFPHVATTTTTTAAAMRTTTPSSNANDADTDTTALSRSNNSANHSERRQWQAAQQRFNHSHDDGDDQLVGGVDSFGKPKDPTIASARDDASSLTFSSPLDRPAAKAPPQKEDIRLRLNQFRAAGAAAAIESTHNNNSKKRSNSSITSNNSELDKKQQSSQPKSTSRKKSPTFTLEQFGFQKSAPTTKKATATSNTTASTRTSKPSSNHHDDSLESSLNGKRHKQNDDEPNDNNEEHATSPLLHVVSLHNQRASESTTTHPTAANVADAIMEIQQKQSSEQQEEDMDKQEEIAGRYQRKRKRLPAPVAGSIAEDPDDPKTTAGTNVVDDLPRTIAEESRNHVSGGNRSSARLSSQANVFPTPSITWDAFAKGGTNQVLLESRRERLAMHERKQSLQEIQQQQEQQKDDSKHNDHAGGPNLSASSSSSRIVTLGKDDFKDMTVIGQFNKGFILTKSRNNHLWIMDQHACDEKYNFEKLVKETVIHEQRLIAPMSLELSTAEETCILDHMEIFEKNGFRFEYRENEAPRHRLALTALPHSGARDGRKAVLFGKEDVSALCMILGCGDDGNHNDDDDDEGNALYQDGVAGGGTGTDGSGAYGNNAVRHAGRRGAAASTSGNGTDTADRVIARLPKAIAMFASRSCRGSIMIGRALSSTEMQRIITHLGEMDHPFTCAHGRPTMQHVSNIGPLLRQDEHKAAEYRAGPTVTVLSQEANDHHSDEEEEL